jgi:hypothetical protein
MRPFVNTVIGFASGILFILATKQVLGSHEDDEEEEEELGPDKLHQVGWRKMVLIMFVMTLHSLTEGVGKFSGYILRLRSPRRCIFLSICDGLTSCTYKFMLPYLVLFLFLLLPGIGVSFGGNKGMQLGKFISLSLAVHNIPEGLAVGLVLTSRKVSKIRAGRCVCLCVCVCVWEKNDTHIASCCIFAEVTMLEINKH